MMSANRSESPRWPALLKELSIVLQSPGSRSSSDQARGEVWLILNSAIFRYLRIHAAELEAANREDLEDLAAQKSLDLLRRIVSAEWVLSNRSRAEIASFLSKVARNSLLDLLREGSRWVHAREGESPEWDIGQAARESTVRMTDPPDIPLERKEFARALRRCVEELSQRSRRIWFLRIFCEMPSKEIAVHPEIGLNASHVDVLLQRCRRAIRDCMRRKGYESRDMPPGTFVELWKVFFDSRGHAAQGGS